MEEGRRSLEGLHKCRGEPFRVDTLYQEGTFPPASHRCLGLVFLQPCWDRSAVPQAAERMGKSGSRGSHCKGL